jgi:hypothetical protein
VKRKVGRYYDLGESSVEWCTGDRSALRLRTGFRVMDEEG